METSHVWAYRLGNPESESEGSLDLESDALVFRLTEEDAQLRWPLERIRKVKRLRGSPVLMLEVDEDGNRTRFAFFFVEPPSLSPKGKESRGRARKRGGAYLAMAAPKYTDLIREWVREIQEAIAAKRG